MREQDSQREADDAAEDEPVLRLGVLALEAPAGLPRPARRRAALLRVFGSIKRVREAPIEQIAAVPGIGANLAAKIKASLEA
jgi:excinuclease ABC subunit C